MSPSRRTYFGWNTGNLLNIVLLGLGLSSLDQLDQGVVANVVSVEWKSWAVFGNRGSGDNVTEMGANPVICFENSICRLSLCKQ